MTAPTETDRFSLVSPEEVPEEEAPFGLSTPGMWQRHKRLFMMLIRILIIVAIGILWWCAGKFNLVSPLTFPSIGYTWHQLVVVTKSGSIFSNSLYTLEGATIGFLIGMGAGTLFGFIIGLSPTLTGIFSPFITVLNVLPRIALAPLYVLWFGIGQGSAIALVISLVLFTALLNTINGTRAVDTNYITIARLYGANRKDIILKVVLPATTPWIITAGRLSLAHALAGAIVAEMFLGQKGLGYLIAVGSGVFNMGVVFAAVFASLIMAIVLNGLGTLLEDHLLRWRPTN